MFRKIAIGGQLVEWDQKDVIMLYSQEMKRHTEKILAKTEARRLHVQPPTCLHMNVDLNALNLIMYRSTVICVYVYGASEKELEFETDVAVSVPAFPVYTTGSLAYLIHRTELESFNRMISEFRKNEDGVKVINNM